MKKKRTKKLTLCFALMSFITVVMGLFVSAGHVSADPVKINPNDPKISPANSIVIKRDIPVSQAEINTTGSSPNVQRKTGNDRPYWGNDSDGTNLIFYSPSSVDKSSVTIKYPLAVGTYGVSETPIFAKMTIHDIKAQPNAPVYTDDQKLPSIMISDKLYNGISLNGIEQARIKLAFFDKDGNTFTIGDGNNQSFLTINSLNQAMGHGKKADGTAQRLLLGNEFAGYENMSGLPYYITDDSILGTYTSPWSGDTVVGGHRDPDNAMQHPDDTVGFNDSLGSSDYSKASASFQVKGSELNFVVGNSGKPSEDNKLNGGETGYYTGQWISFSSATLWDSAPKDPVKDVIQDQKSINHKSVKPNEKFEYTVSQKVGTMNVDMLQKYNAFELSDPLPKEVKYLNNAYLTCDNGIDYSKNAGNITYEDGVVKFEASSDFLSTVMPYNGETYTLHIPVQVNSDVKGGIDVKNYAYSLINKSHIKTNTVVNPTIKDPDYKVTKKIFTGTFDKVNDWDGLFKTSENNHDSNDGTDSKSKDSKDRNAVSDDSVLKDETKLKDTADNSDVNFVFQHHLNHNGNKLTSFKTIDNLDKAITAKDIKSIKVFDKTGKDLTNDFTVLADGNSITTEAKDVSKLDKIENIYLKMTVNLTKNYDYGNVKKDSESGDYIIPNQSSMLVNDKNYDSNEVQITIPNPKNNPDPKKTVSDKDNNDINHQIVKNGDVLTYRVTQPVGILEKDLLKPYKSFSFSDKLDSRLKYQTSYMVTSPKNSTTETKLENVNDTEFDSKTNTVSWNAKTDFLNDRKAMPLNGESYTMVIEAKVDTSNGEAVHNSSDGSDSDIKNQAEVTINNDPKKTNEVDNPIKPVTPAPVKTVTDKNDKDINMKSVKDGDDLIYHVDQPVNKLGKDTQERYKSFEMIDKLDGRASFVKAYVIDKSTKETVANSDSGVSYDDSSRVVTFKASDDFLKNMKLDGRTYSLIIEAKAKLPKAKSENGNKDKDDDENSIVNKATVNINDNPQVTNEVRNPYTPVKTDMPDPVKTVTDVNGKDINMKYVVDGQTIHYNVLQTITKDNNTGLEMSDTLDTRLEYQKAYVIDSETKKTLADSKSGVSYDNSSRLVSFKANKDFVKNMEKGKTYALVIVAKVKLPENKQSSATDSNKNQNSSNDATDNSVSSENSDSNGNSDETNNSENTESFNDNMDQVEQTEENTIPNVASVTLNGKTKTTNKVENPYSPSTPDKTTTETPTGTQAGTPNNPATSEPSSEKLAQTGSKNLNYFIYKLKESIFSFFG